MRSRSTPKPQRSYSARARSLPGNTARVRCRQWCCLAQSSANAISALVYGFAYVRSREFWPKGKAGVTLEEEPD